MMNYCYAIAAAVVVAILLTLRSNWIEMIRTVAFVIVVYLAAVAVVVVLRLAEYFQREEAAEVAATSYVAAAVEMQSPWKVLVVSYS